MNQELMGEQLSRVYPPSVSASFNNRVMRKLRVQLLQRVRRLALLQRAMMSFALAGLFAGLLLPAEQGGVWLLLGELEVSLSSPGLLVGGLVALVFVWSAQRRTL